MNVVQESIEETENPAFPKTSFRLNNFLSILGVCLESSDTFFSYLKVYLLTNSTFD